VNPRRFGCAAPLLLTGLLAAACGSVSAGHGAAPAGSARHPGCRGLGWSGNLYPLAPPGSGAAEKTTVAGVQAAVGFPVPVPVPSTAAASRASLTHVWVSSHTLPRKQRQVALVFDKGKIDILMHRATYRSDLHYFHAFVREKKENGGVTAAIRQVNGRPALVIWPDTNAKCPNPAVVDFNRHGVDVTIYSNTKTYGVHAVLAIARQHALACFRHRDQRTAAPHVLRSMVSV
jgi:hypothetical protein